jgi:glycosyltransferase involved in cell wall biosynthesis
MRICIDATSLLLRSAGVKNYIYRWVEAMQRECTQHSITAFPFIGDIGELNHEASVLSLWQTIPRLAMLHFVNVRFNPAIDLLMAGVDVFHASNQVRNPPARTKLTGTLYDMTCLLMPQNHTPGNVQAERNFADRVLSRADGLIAISEHTKRDTVELLNIDPRKISVIYPGVPDAFFHVTEADRKLAAEKYRLTRPFALFVGTVEPRKNIDALLDAFEQLPPDVREAFELIAVGPLGWATGATVQRLKNTPGVRHLGYVPEQDLPGITAAAAIFVYPSLYEGFGFPVAQSMAAGVPILTSNVSSLPEVARDAAVLVSPQSESEIRDGMLRLLTSPSERERLAARGREIAAEYTWTNAALKSARFFESLF